LLDSGAVVGTNTTIYNSKAVDNGLDLQGQCQGQGKL